MKFRNFGKFSNLKYGLSEKPDGPMELATGDLGKADNRLRFYVQQNIDPLKVVSARQSHSAKAVKVINREPQIIVADGLVTQARELFLTVTVADCFPVYFFEPKSQSLAIAHCGWRGTLGGVIANTVIAMNSSAADILVGIGPGIGRCHFEVQNDVLDKFQGYPEAVFNRKGKIFIDLPKIISLQLKAAGVPADNIESCGLCTFCQSDKYFSFRRDKPPKVQAMLAYIALV
jgi:hypothetical protein